MPQYSVSKHQVADAGCKLSFVNPVNTENSVDVWTIKTNKVDANVLARFGMVMHAELLLWQPAPVHYQQLKHLHNRKHTIETNIKCECNQLKKLQSTQREAFVIASLEHMIQHLEKELKWFI